jgi:hypothetical protein
MLICKAGAGSLTVGAGAGGLIGSTGAGVFSQSIRGEGVDTIGDFVSCIDEARIRARVSAIVEICCSRLGDCGDLHNACKG